MNIFQIVDGLSRGVLTGNNVFPDHGVSRKRNDEITVWCTLLCCSVYSSPFHFYRDYLLARPRKIRRDVFRVAQQTFVNRGTDGQTHTHTHTHTRRRDDSWPCGRAASGAVGFRAARASGTKNVNQLVACARDDRFFSFCFVFPT